MELTLFHNPMSRSSIAYYLMLELGIPFDVKLLSFKLREHKSKDYLKVCPAGKVPSLKVNNNLVINENHAIAMYLCDMDSKSGLLPEKGDPLRGAVFDWMFFNAGCLEQAVTDKSLNQLHDDQASRIGYGTYDITINRLRDALKKGPYLFGDTFTVADVMIGMSLDWYLQFNIVEKHPEFVRMVDNIHKRPAFKVFETQMAKQIAELKVREA